MLAFESSDACVRIFGCLRSNLRIAADASVEGIVFRDALKCAFIRSGRTEPAFLTQLDSSGCIIHLHSSCSGFTYTFDENVSEYKWALFGWSGSTFFARFWRIVLRLGLFLRNFNEYISAIRGGKYKSLAFLTFRHLTFRQIYFGVTFVCGRVAQLFTHRIRIWTR